MIPQKWHHAHGHVDTDVVLDAGGPRLYGDIFRKFTGGSLRTPAFVGAHQVLTLRSNTFIAPRESMLAMCTCALENISGSSGRRR